MNGLACLINYSRLGVAVYPRVSSKFIRPRKSFCAARVLAYMRLLSSMCSNMSCLMFETMKSFVAQGTCMVVGGPVGYHLRVGHRSWVVSY